MEQSLIVVKLVVGGGVSLSHATELVLSGLGCSLLGLIQDVAASTQSATCDMNEVTAEDRHKPHSWMSSA